MKTVNMNEVKKGTKFTHKDGRTGELLDSKKGNIRLVKIQSFFSPDDYDHGSIYIKDISSVIIDGEYCKVVQSPVQKKRSNMVSAFGF